ncbi:uncharacterized protein LOC127281325 [Leptopilina boulardi]|uniref:uncharacterized protein LOC127281325 n=1 Tax=Leptopilina boulardi TaxID=63433 RepID=UPI0021F515DF|nr:uncharacterized protein LOC127281325 [Leptopilina boulardi]
MTLVFQNFRIIARCSLINFIQKSQCHTLKTEILPKSVYSQLGEKPAEIFLFIKNNHGYLSGHHYLQALRKLNKTSFNYNDVKNNNDFAELCDELKKQLTTLDVSDVVSVLNELTKFRIEKNTVIYESLLQLIRTNINSLHIDDIITLQMALQNGPNTPLINAILKALPTLFDKLLDTIDFDNIHLMASCLVFATKCEKHNYRNIEFLLDAIDNYRDDIPLTSAKFILKSIRFLPHFEKTHNRLLKRVQNIIIQKIDRISFIDAIVILKSIQFTKNVKALYNDTMVDSLVNMIIKTDVGLEQGVETLEKLVKIGHEQVALLDYIAIKFVDKSNRKDYKYLNMLDVFVSAMAMCDYKSIFWDVIQELILNNNSIDSYENITELVVNLAILDSYSDKLLRLILEKNTNIEWMPADQKLKILKLYQIIKTLYLDYDGPRPLEDKLELLVDWNQYNYKKSPIYKALEIAVGGSEYIESKVKTKLGHFIDHVILWDKSSAKPIPISYENSERNENSTTDFNELKPITYLEDISVPDETQVLLFVDIPTNGFTINAMQLKGSWNSYIKTLEAMNYLVIPICSENWQQLPDKERIPYLVHAMRLKCATHYNPL